MLLGSRKRACFCLVCWLSQSLLRWSVLWYCSKDDNMQYHPFVRETAFVAVLRGTMFTYILSPKIPEWLFEFNMLIFLFDSLNRVAFPINPITKRQTCFCVHRKGRPGYLTELTGVLWAHCYNIALLSRKAWECKSCDLWRVWCTQDYSRAGATCYSIYLLISWNSALRDKIAFFIFHHSEFFRVPLMTTTPTLTPTVKWLRQPRVGFHHCFTKAFLSRVMHYHDSFCSFFDSTWLYVKLLVSVFLQNGTKFFFLHPTHYCN